MAIPRRQSGTCWDASASARCGLEKGWSPQISCGSIFGAARAPTRTAPLSLGGTDHGSIERCGWERFCKRFSRIVSEGAPGRLIPTMRRVAFLVPTNLGSDSPLARAPSRWPKITSAESGTCWDASALGCRDLPAWYLGTGSPAWSPHTHPMRLDLWRAVRRPPRMHSAGSPIAPDC